jgi:hypothetical protein
MTTHSKKRKFFKFEDKKSPLITSELFFWRMWRYFLYSSAIVLISLAIGVVGYHYFGELGWIDSLLNASMILTGMGPVSPMTTNASKIFASFYALYSGIAFLTIAAIFIAPLAHRLLHILHLENEPESNG